MRTKYDREQPWAAGAAEDARSISLRLRMPCYVAAAYKACVEIVVEDKNRIGSSLGGSCEARQYRNIERC